MPVTRPDELYGSSFVSPPISVNLIPPPRFPLLPKVPLHQNHTSINCTTPTLSTPPIPHVQRCLLSPHPQLPSPSAGPAINSPPLPASSLLMPQPNDEAKPTPQAPLSTAP